ncbi:MAG: hypothetical protein WA984_00920 [Phormidesmis sp.]
MSRRLLEPIDQLNTTHHLECPRGQRHSIVSTGAGKYACLNCHWQRDVTNDWGDGPPPFIVIMAIVIIVVIMMSGG